MNNPPSKPVVVSNLGPLTRERARRGVAWAVIAVGPTRSSELEQPPSANPSSATSSPCCASRDLDQIPGTQNLITS